VSVSVGSWRGPGAGRPRSLLICAQDDEGAEQGQATPERRPDATAAQPDIRRDRVPNPPGRRTKQPRAPAHTVERSQDEFQKKWRASTAGWIRAEIQEGQQQPRRDANAVPATVTIAKHSRPDRRYAGARAPDTYNPPIIPSPLRRRRSCKGGSETQLQHPDDRRGNLDVASAGQ
jgi:hypothetical protein